MPLDWFHRMFPADWRVLGKAPKNCPKCGRQMVTRTVYYECRGCGHVENAPKAKVKRDIQPIDNLLGGRQSTPDSTASAWESEFAFATVPPEMETEYRWLFRLGLIIFIYTFLGWGGMIWLGLTGDDDLAFKLCWGLSCFGGALLVLAQLSSSASFKQLGLWLAFALAGLLIYTGCIIPAEAKYELLIDNPNMEYRVLGFLLFYSFYAAAAYCAWLAAYTYRERRLAGW